MDPKTGEVTYSLAQVLLAESIAEKKPEMQSQALYYFARAAALDGQGALNPDGRKKVDDYLTKIYTTLHGDTTGLAELKATAKANPIAPADFKIKTAAEIASEKEEDLKKTNPELALWLNVKGQLLSPEGQTYFDSSMKGAAVPKLKGWLVSAKPPVKSKELLISMEGKDQTPNVTLKLVGSDGTTPAPLTGKPEVGVEVQFEGIGDSFTKEPLNGDVRRGEGQDLHGYARWLHHFEGREGSAGAPSGAQEAVGRLACSSRGRSGGDPTAETHPCKGGLVQLCCTFTLANARLNITRSTGFRRSCSSA